MSNMSYCKFQNTLHDLRDCYESISDSDLSEDEFHARKGLIKMCSRIIEECYDENDAPFGDWDGTYDEYKLANPDNDKDENGEEDAEV